MPIANGWHSGNMENMTRFSLFLVNINSYKQKNEYLQGLFFIVNPSISQSQTTEIY